MRTLEVNGSRPSIRDAVAILAGGVLLFGARPRAAQEPTLATVLGRAADYVADFHRRLSSIVAEERYVQDWRRGRTPGSHRELLSDLLLVKPGLSTAWMEFRDVFEVDGTPIRDRNERLVKMFLEPSPSTARQIGKILSESARFNIGDVTRNVNTPVFSLQFLEAANQRRFTFKRTGDGRSRTITGDAAPADGAFRVSTEVWAIAYHETGPHTIIRTGQGKYLKSFGRFWIEPATGRVLMSELVAEPLQVRATIDVSFQSEPLLGMLVPIEMRERYENRRVTSLVTGRATYGRFRQFQVNVDEKLAPIKK
jgi:hypothetical protein